MKIIPFVAIVIVILGLSSLVHAQSSDDMFTIYLIRHAEKDLTTDNQKDPLLTMCGQERALSIANFLEKVNIEAIYSTNYIRTKSTAQPSANNKGLEVEIYDHKDAASFVQLLLECKEDALVVGHSNSTPTLAGLLVGDESESIDEKVYNRIYQVVIYKNTGRLHVFQTDFSCNN